MPSPNKRMRFKAAQIAADIGGRNSQNFQTVRWPGMSQPDFDSIIAAFNKKSSKKCAFLPSKQRI
jgi:hypothetical protein